MNIDVHELKPGALGLIAHKMKPHELNAWVKRIGVDPIPYYSSDLLYPDGSLYMLDKHIPHSTLVLVVSKKQLKKCYSNTSWPFYTVIWNEMIYLVKRDLVINPHANNIQES